MTIRKLGLWLALALFMGCRTARAALWVSLDFDSLTNGSDVIIEGQITNVKELKAGLFEVRVTQVDAGNAVKTGEKLMVEAAVYEKPKPGKLWQVEPLEVGDKLFYFLSQNLERGQTKTSPGIWHPLRGGVKLIFNGHVAEFSQHYMNPGPVAAETEADFIKRGQPTVEEYRNMIAKSVTDVAAFRAKLKAAIAGKDSSGLVELLRQRAAIMKTRVENWDLLAGETDKALIELHDYAALDEAMKIAGMRGGMRYHAGFATLEGIAFLRAKMNDVTLGTAERIRYIDALPRVGDLQGKDGAVIRPPHYLLDMAKMAVVNKRDRELSANLMEVVGGWAIQGEPLDDGSREDLYAALAVMKDFYASSTDAEVREQIEWMTWQADRRIYEKLGSECGPIVSRAYIPKDLGSYVKPADRDLIVSFSIGFCFAEDGDHVLRNEPMMRGADGVVHSATFVIPMGGGFDASKSAMNTGSRGGFTCTIRPPADLSAGKYELYLRFSENGNYVGRSHGVEVMVSKG